MAKLAESALDKYKRVLNTEKDREEWIVDAWNSCKGTSGLLGLIPEWRDLVVIEKEKRQDEWFRVLKSYYCVKYCEKVSKYTNPKKSKRLVDDTPGMYYVYL